MSVKYVSIDFLALSLLYQGVVSVLTTFEVSIDKSLKTPEDYYQYHISAVSQDALFESKWFCGQNKTAKLLHVEVEDDTNVHIQPSTDLSEVLISRNQALNDAMVYVSIVCNNDKKESNSTKPSNDCCCHQHHHSHYHHYHCRHHRHGCSPRRLAQTSSIETIETYEISSEQDSDET